MAKMLPGQLLFATPNCQHCGMLSDSKSTYHGEDFFILMCSHCRDVMDGTIDELAYDLMNDPKVLEAYKDQPEDQRQQALLTLAEDMYFFGLDDDEDL